MYRPFLHIILCLLPFALRAQQNLVPNPSFEDTLHCPLYLADFSPVNWQSANSGTPDYYHACQISNPNVGVPENAWGWQWPRTGNAYVGIVNNAYPGTNVREYIQCELLDSLRSGEEYIIEFFISRADRSGKASDNIGAFLSNEPIFQADIGYLPYVPQIVNSPSQALVDEVNWIHITDTIVAHGGERHLTIGVFNHNTNWLEVDGVVEYDAVLYLDDISVVRIIKSIDLPNVFTPNGDGVNDALQIVSSGFVDGEVKIYDRWGRLVFSEVGTKLQWDGKMKHQQMNAGVYYVVLTMQDAKNRRTVKKGFVHLLR